jgi:hypothetical protein
MVPAVRSPELTDRLYPRGGTDMFEDNPQIGKMLPDIPQDRQESLFTVQDEGIGILSVDAQHHVSLLHELQQGENASVVPHSVFGVGGRSPGVIFPGAHAEIEDAGKLRFIDGSRDLKGVEGGKPFAVRQGVFNFPGVLPQSFGAVDRRHRVGHDEGPAESRSAVRLVGRQQFPLPDVQVEIVGFTHANHGNILSIRRQYE